MDDQRSRAPRRIRALLFDTFGTVVDWRTSVSAEVERFFGRHGVVGDPARFADEWRAQYQPSLERIRDGSRPFTRLDRLHRKNLLTVLRSWGIETANIEPAEIDDRNTAWHRLDPWLDTVPGLTTLRKSFLVAPLPNGNLSMLTNMAKRAAIPWDCILGAEVLRMYKPQLEFYRMTADILGLIRTSA